MLISHICTGMPTPLFRHILLPGGTKNYAKPGQSSLTALHMLLDNPTHFSNNFRIYMQLLTVPNYNTLDQCIQGLLQI